MDLIDGLEFAIRSIEEGLAGDRARGVTGFRHF
jgi:hypothetical protein